MDSISRFRAIGLLLAGTLWGCAATQQPPTDPPTGSASPLYVYSCSDEQRLIAAFGFESVTLDFADSRVTLPQRVSASGARYSDGEIEFWIKGTDATLERGSSRVECSAIEAENPWRAAYHFGSTFRGVGQEPGWTLDVMEDGSLRYAGDYATTVVRFPSAERSAASGDLRYHARAEGHELTATVAETPCQDTMSGESFTYTVILQFDGQQLNGCGRVPSPTEQTRRF